MAAWLAVFALVFATLAPGISHALAAAKGQSSLWMEICTAAGAKLVNLADLSKDASDSVSPVAPANDSAPVAPESGSMHFEHCPFCFTHAASFALPPAAVMALPLLDTHYAFPSLYYHAPRPLFAWSVALARAPPAFS